MFTRIIDRDATFEPNWDYWTDARLQDTLPDRIWAWLARGADPWGMAATELWREMYHEVVIGCRRDLPRAFAIWSQDQPGNRLALLHEPVLDASLLAVRAPATHP